LAGIVVVGAGQAAISCVARLRKQGVAGPVTVIGAEDVPPYQRPPLSKAYLKGEMALDRMLLRPPHWYADNEVEMLVATPAEAIDPAARRVTAGGETIPYEALVLATGAAPRRLPAEIGGDLGHVHVVRTLADVDALAGDMRPGARLVVVGGGYIGLEAAAVAAELGLEVTLLEAAPRILGRVAAPETADFFRRLHAAHGVTLREGVTLARLEGTGDVTGVRLKDGSVLPADLVVVGIGVTPEVDLARKAGAEIDNGIAVDAHGRTSLPHVWAAGDCASFPWRGARIRLESVQNAIDQAECVADNLAGIETVYDPCPWFWSDQYDVKLQIAGLNAGYDRVAVRPGASAGSASHWYYRGDDLIAVDAMNEPRAYMVGKRLIEAGRSPAARDVADPAADLKALLAAG
jgi:3-phenylpropionate/trans-cinnamate dioxygenase ferredoxin reductase subunit